MPLNVVFFEAPKLVPTKNPITKALLPPSRHERPQHSELHKTDFKDDLKK